MCWSKSNTTKGLRHITIRENAIRESVDTNFIEVLHIDGKTNLADMFTKEMKDVGHFKTLRDFVVHPGKYESEIMPSFSVGKRGVLNTTV